jgi:hypothetical protein
MIQASRACVRELQRPAKPWPRCTSFQLFPVLDPDPIWVGVRVVCEHACLACECSTLRRGVQIDTFWRFGGVKSATDLVQGLKTHVGACETKFT